MSQCWTIAGLLRSLSRQLTSCSCWSMIVFTQSWGWTGSMLAWLADFGQELSWISTWTIWWSSGLERSRGRMTLGGSRAW